MEWLRAHPYTSALSAAGILLLMGILVVERQIMRPAEGPATAWGGGAAPFLNPTSYQPSQDTENSETLMQDITDGPPYTYIPPKPSTNSGPAQNQDSYDFEAFITLLTKASTPKPQNDTGLSSSSSMDAYAYIPRGLISTTSPSGARTETQQLLYEYGNEIGSSIESFEQEHSNTPQILKEQVEDRTNPDKAAAVVNLGRALEAMGANLSGMDRVPGAMAAAHKALAESYREIGKNLALIPKAQRDQDFIQAIETYNASADTFTKRYIQIVSLFGAYGVTFTSSDPGRVFTFSPSGF